jgi:hypothetical protein
MYIDKYSDEKIWSIVVMRSLHTNAGGPPRNPHGRGAINHLAPYGDVKQSGIGRKSGIEGIGEYVQSQTITRMSADRSGSKPRKACAAQAFRTYEQARALARYRRWCRADRTNDSEP